MRKKVLAVLLTAAILCSLLVTAAGAVSVGNFTDVDSGKWYYEYVDYVTSRDYMIGESDTIFAPEDNMTRAMFVTVLARVAGAKLDDTAVSFDDVPANTWYTGAVAWAKATGVTLGTEGNNFLPEAEVTREQMAVFMARFVDYYAREKGVTHKNDGTISAFVDDAEISAWAKASVDRCRVWGLVVGYPGDVYGPLDFSTRAEVAAVISRLDWMVNTPAPIPAPQTKDYTVELKLTAGAQDITLTAVYENINVNGSNDVDVATVANDLISGTNKNKLQNAYDYAADLAKGTYTKTNAASDTLVVNVNDDLSITATKNGADKDVKEFLANLDADYAANKDAVVAAALKNAGMESPSAAVKAAAEKIYDDNTPSKYFTVSETSVAIADFDTFYANLQTAVNDAIALYEAAGKDSAAYSSECFPSVISALSRYSITGAADASLADVLGNDVDKVLTNYTASKSGIATITGNTSTCYASIVDYLMSTYTITGKVDKLTSYYDGTLPAKLADKDFSAVLSITVE